MRSENNGLRAQTTTSPHSCEVCNTRALTREEKNPINKRLLRRNPAVRLEPVTMRAWGGNWLLVAVPLWMCFGRAAAALSEPQICYVLDGILFLYGIILTVLYCRIKISNAKEASSVKGKSKQNVEEGIYTGLTPHVTDTYETIGTKK
ncbi:hypothetical protein CHARACLAT_006981 [Characodon lateralis]|uniref:High affinity immunoglobulin epsilon receptor subunit gamma n=1 Tax=Characodon lateralis TaxID=208331 RepID=A0ABU7D5G0_9TELE|nr:hypothetical protein [Characodon lateralis]